MSFYFSDIALLLGENFSHLLNLYESLMLRRILATDPDTRWCPRPNCTFAVIAAGCASCPRIECEHPGCGYAFCYHCKAEWHPNQTCDAARAQRNPQNFRYEFANFAIFRLIFDYSDFLIRYFHVFYVFTS